jgi:hypothetical protein
LSESQAPHKKDINWTCEIMKSMNINTEMNQVKHTTPRIANNSVPDDTWLWNLVLSIVRIPMFQECD